MQVPGLCWRPVSLGQAADSACPALLLSRLCQRLWHQQRQPLGLAFRATRPTAWRWRRHCQRARRSPVCNAASGGSNGSQPVNGAIVQQLVQRAYELAAQHDRGVKMAPESIAAKMRAFLAEGVVGGRGGVLPGGLQGASCGGRGAPGRHTAAAGGLGLHGRGLQPHLRGTASGLG